MPRTPPAREPLAATTQLEQLNAVVASAAQLTKTNMARPRNTGGGGDWQNEAWYFYDTIGEFRFGANWKSQAMSRCRLIIEELTDEGTWGLCDDTNGPEWTALRLLFGGDAGQSQAMAMFGLHLEVPGESYLVGEVLNQDGLPDPNGTDTWTVYSNEELKPKGNESGSYELDRGDGKKRTITAGNEPGDAWVIRLWRSHPRRWVEADSPARAALPILREVENLSKDIGAHIDSRLAGAGILLLPLEASLIGGTAAAPGVVQVEGDADAPVDPTAQDRANKLLSDLMESMVTPIANRDHPSAVVPHLLQVPGQYLDKVKHLTLSTPMDDKLLEMRTAALRRAAVTANMPAEVILGIGDINHWGAWQLEESAIKMHIEPDAEVITSGLSTQWLPIAVEALGGRANPNRRVGVDTSDLRLRPDRTAQAQWLYEHFEIDGAALRRELGIEGDAPTPEEVQDALLKRLAAEGLATPEVVVWAIRSIITGQPPGPPPEPTPAEVSAGQGNQIAIERGGGNNPDQSPPADTGPETPHPPAQAASAAEAAVLASAELLVARAVERASNRARQRGRNRGTPTPEQMDADLRGAWDDVPRTCNHLGLDPEWFTERLDTYARGLLATGSDHQPQVLRKVLGS